MILDRAVELGCSDLHLSSQKTELVILARIDGGMRELARLPREWRDQLTARLRVMSGATSYTPQHPTEGAISARLEDGTTTVLRASFLPTLHGESINIRFPDRGALPMDFNALGMPPQIQEQLDRLLFSQERTLLLTGPSNSGKTTSIYSMLTRLHAREPRRLNFLTIEDPVERDLPFADQVQVDEPRGLTFEVALSAALRQDPDVLVIGEIRDLASARVAMQAGLTGHLVLSTIHAGRAAAVFMRLLTIGIERYIVASAMSGAIAQRLARLLCIKCKRQDDGGWVAPGCTHCGYSGVHGRTGIFELVAVNEAIREMVLSNMPPTRLIVEIEKTQKLTLQACGEGLVQQGQIARAELDYLLSLEPETPL